VFTAAHRLPSPTPRRSSPCAVKLSEAVAVELHPSTAPWLHQVRTGAAGHHLHRCHCKPPSVGAELYDAAVAAALHSCWPSSSPMRSSSIPPLPCTGAPPHPSPSAARPPLPCFLSTCRPSPKPHRLPVSCHRPLTVQVGHVPCVQLGCREIGPIAVSCFSFFRCRFK
jgi:hypothetical protein